MISLNQTDTGRKIAIFCGGRGSSELANQLLDAGNDVTCCVNAYDDGLSTGRIRQFFHVLGPSDIRKNLLSLMDIDAKGYWSRYEVFAYRYPADEEKAGRFRAEIEAVCNFDRTDQAGLPSEFSRMLERNPADFERDVKRFLTSFIVALRDAESVKGQKFSFSDCALGNCILVGALLENDGNWFAAIQAMEKMLQTRGRVELVSDQDLYLSAICEDGRVLPSEASVIGESNGDIVSLFLTKNPADEAEFIRVIEQNGLNSAIKLLSERFSAEVTAAPSAISAIEKADELIYGSGTFYSSILPTLMIPEVTQAISRNSGLKTMILNIVEEADTRGFQGIDLVRRIVDLVGPSCLDRIAVNMPSAGRGEQYFSLNRTDLDSIGVTAEIIKGDFESRTRPGRHDPILLVNAISKNKLELGDGLENSGPLVSVVMLAWNRKAEVEIGLLEMSKLNYRNVEFLVVDNGSTDGTAQMLFEKFPYVNVIRLHKNTGMTGYNVGLATAKGKYVIMLDDDSHLAPDSITKMVKIWEAPENADVGTMAFRVVNPNTGSLVTHLWEERLGHIEPGREREITSFAACGAAVKREMLDEVGYFDDDFFLYATEDDLSIRIWDAGYKIVYEPRCISYHRESQLMRNWKRYGFGFRNATWFNIKHLPLYLLPLMLLRNLFWLFTRSVRFRSFQYLFYGFVGLVKGYFQFSTPLRKRKPVRTSIAKFCLNDNWITRPIISTSWRIYKDKRYILDKRGVTPGIK